MLQRWTRTAARLVGQQTATRRSGSSLLWASGKNKSVVCGVVSWRGDGVGGGVRGGVLGGGCALAAGSAPRRGFAAAKRVRRKNEPLHRVSVGGVTVEEGIAQVLQNAKAKFDESIDIAVNLGCDPRKPDQSVRTSTVLPHSFRKRTIAVFAKGPKAEEAKAAGADIVGAEDLAETVQGGTIDFDVCLATPDMMSVAARVARVLGPRGLMPSPKTGTLTMDLTAAIKDAKAGQVAFRTDRFGVVRAPFGKASFTAEQLQENLVAFIAALRDAKPSGARGVFIRKVVLSSTMGPGVKLDIAVPPFRGKIDPITAPVQQQGEDAPPATEQTQTATN